MANYNRLSHNPYGYKELHEAALTGDQEAINALGKWMDNYGMKCWNGECFFTAPDGNDSECLYPVYEQNKDYPDCYDVVRYEFR